MPFGKGAWLFSACTHQAERSRMSFYVCVSCVRRACRMSLIRLRQRFWTPPTLLAQQIMVCGIADADSLNENEQNSQNIQEKSTQRTSTNKFGYDEKSSENEPEKCVIRRCGAHGVRYCSR